MHNNLIICMELKPITQGERDISKKKAVDAKVVFALVPAPMFLKASGSVQCFGKISRKVQKLLTEAGSVSLIFSGSDCIE